MKLQIINIEGKETGREAELSEDVFGIEPNEHAVYLDVKNILANRRQGTAKVKERGEIKGSTRKIKKQKGTGTARAGSIKSPIFRGGGTIFGPRQRDYGFKLNKKVKKLARKSVLSARVKESALVVLEDFTFESPKTKQFLSVLNSLSLSGKKSVFVVAEESKNVFLSGRNIQKTGVKTVSQISTYDLINADTVVVSESALVELNERFN